MTGSPAGSSITEKKKYRCQKTGRKLTNAPGESFKGKTKVRPILEDVDGRHISDKMGGEKRVTSLSAAKKGPRKETV